MRTPRPRLAALLLAGLLAGCTVGPDFRRPTVAGPAQWGGEPQDVASHTFGGQVDGRWWDSFHDPELTRLVGRLMAQNLDLQAAAERVSQGRAQRDAAASAGLPHLSASGSYMRTHQSEKGFISLVEPAPGAPIEYDFFQDSVNASWDLDLFGRVRRTVESQQANTEAVIEARHAVALAALADLAQDYMQLRGLQARTGITRENLALAERNTALVRSQFANGTGTTLDIAQAQAQQAAIAATLPALETQQAAMINAIGFLLALPPRALDAELRVPEGQAVVQPAVPPTVPVGLPSELARRRPDIREAEAKLHEATAQTGVAVASFYPNVSLTGRFGFEALRLPDMFNMAARSASVGPAVNLPIFEGGELRSVLRLRKSQQREAAIAYRRTVLAAWQEVDDALTAYAQAQHQRTQIDEAFRQDRIALGAARQRYQQGVIDFLNVISAQNAMLQAESALATSNTQIETALVGLYRALGGGWQQTDLPAR